MTNKTDNSPGNTAGTYSRICAAFLLACFLFPIPAQAKTADFVSVGNIQNYSLGTWTGMGSLAQERVFCVASANDDSPNPGSGVQMPYQAKVEESGGSPGDFYLYLNNDPASTGNQRIRISFLHKDMNDGNSFEQLGFGTWDTHNHVGSFRNCQSGDNSVLRVEISSSDLAGKVSGTYRNDFLFSAVGGSSGSATDNGSFRVTISIQASPEVQVSSLNDLSLGTHAGLGNIYAEENFCVYSTSTSGSYSLSVSSTNQDGSGNFFLAGGTGQIPYDLYFSDQATGPGTVKVSNTGLSGFGNSTDQFCNGSNNATLSVSISEQVLQQAKSGAYSDSLVILVAPQ